MPSSVTQAEKNRRWRLLLGQGYENDAFSEEDSGRELVLNTVYGKTVGREGGRESHAMTPVRLLSDMRSLFSDKQARLMQKDAIQNERYAKLLFEPDALRAVKPDIGLALALLSRKERIPERSMAQAAQIIGEVAGEIKKKLYFPMTQAYSGAVRRKTRVSGVSDVDWKRTVERNLKNYNPKLKKIIPQKIYFTASEQKKRNKHIILCIDQSDSMSESAIYAAITGCILSEIADTRVVAFGTEVIDLTDACGENPIAALFGLRLGGGTNIGKALAYCEALMTEPHNTLLVLLTDLFDSSGDSALLGRLERFPHVLCLLGLTEHGFILYNESLAQKIAGTGVYVAKATLGDLPEILGKTLCWG